MAIQTVERSIVVQAAHGNAWGFVSDFRNWGKLLSEGKSSGSYVFQAESHLGAGVRIKFNTVPPTRPQTFVVTVWEPPNGLAMRIEPDRAVTSYDMSVSVALKPVSAMTTSVAVRVDFEWRTRLMRMMRSALPAVFGVERTVDGLCNSLQSALLG